jgi:hypothetical protein
MWFYGEELRDLFRASPARIADFCGFEEVWVWWLYDEVLPFCWSVCLCYSMALGWALAAVPMSF